MNTIVKNFERHLIEDGKSIKTIESYVGDVTGLIKYLESMGVEFDGTLKRFYITSYKNNLIENGYEPTTINKKINSFMSLNNYLIEKGYMNEVVIDLRKDRVKIATGSEHQVEVFSDRLVERILFYIQNQKKVRLRDRMIIQILMFIGVRVSELCDIKIKNIDFLTGHLKVIGKGGKLREVPLKPEVVESIKEYLVVRNKNPYRDSEYLLLGQRGAIKRDAVNTLLEKYTRQGEFEVKLKPHTFRHTFCTRLINKGVPITTVSKLAGHSSVETTARFYINSSK
ncbi:tyrosine-type recombinase/integrase [Oceanirhabdus sp. W0125-5]|uniref:tyrosine-type recombinase/integrase n=1 Tax=Oceanirhabdus sp. W0125-5 TaxID=2999116 RepID=UPI0022F340B3|nr:tyrosine-type recombinase/integrase [Oceanirhabdus sp. W0125-5]WBW97311.1 tyrosine-type recombinase/integrase [Oceanirhabdus sp. W0125-5]